MLQALLREPGGIIPENLLAKCFEIVQLGVRIAQGDIQSLPIVGRSEHVGFLESVMYDEISDEFLCIVQFVQTQL